MESGVELTCCQDASRNRAPPGETESGGWLQGLPGTRRSETGHGNGRGSPQAHAWLV